MAFWSGFTVYLSAGTTVGMETTMESVMSRHTHEQTGNNTGMSRPPTETGRLPDYREPPLGFFDGEACPTVSVPQQPSSDTVQGRNTVFIQL